MVTNVDIALVTAVDGHWNRARALLAAETGRVATASDRRLWKLWPIDAAAGAFVSRTRNLPK